MSEPFPVVIATSTKYGSARELRAKLALRTIRLAKTRGYPVVIVDNGSPSVFLEKLRALGATVAVKKKSAMGGQRRHALAMASNLAGANGVVVWTEPEKIDCIKKLQPLLRLMRRGTYDLVIPRRRSLASYPPEQQHTESVMDMAFHSLTGLRWDISFGPFLANRRALKYFLQYRGEYGDRWEALFVPRLRVLKAGLRVAAPVVAYTHPPAQTKAETGSPDFFMKRIDQMANVFSGMRAEAEKLGLVKKR